MHGRCEGGGEGCDKRRLRVRHMWPTTRVEAAPPPAQGPATPPSSSVPPHSATSYPPAPTTPPAPAQKQGRFDSPRPVSPDSFVKDGREFRVGDCALFQANNAPPFVGLIHWIEKKEGYPKLRVSWLYRPVDVKLNKGIQLNAAPNEIFYSFHQDETSSVSLLHPCKVAFLRKGVELPAGISSFVCRRVYDIYNKCLWWLTDKDYISERQEEVNRLLHRTTLEMHAAVQSGGRSPKRLNGPSVAQQKSSSDGTQNCGPSKGKKRDRAEQGNDPAKRDRDRPVKVEESESGNLKVENMKSEIAKITEKGGLPHAEAVEKLVHLMQLDRTERKIDFAARVKLADIIAATESPDCLARFVQLRGLPVLDDWLQEVHKGKSGEGSSPKETDKPIEEFIFALLRALAKLPINLNALQSCSIGKSVNHLRSHKNLEIQKKAKCLVENWKKRVDAEMKLNDVKAALSGQAAPWPGKTGFSEISNAGNKRSVSSESSMKNQVSQISSSKALTAKSGAGDAVVKSTLAISGSSKSQHMQPANVTSNSKDQPCKSTGGTELPTVKEERSSSSSQSLNNSQSCSSDHAKTVGSWKEDARSSTAASGNASKSSGGSSRGHRRVNNGRLGSGIKKEAVTGGSGSLDRSSLPEKSAQSGMACEKGGDTPSDHANGHRLIVRFPNPGRSPARSASGGSLEDPSVTGSRVSSPVLTDKYEHNDRRVKIKTEHSHPHVASETNAESWHSNDIKGATGSDDGDKSPCAILEDDRSKTAEEAGKDVCASRVANSLYVNEKGACSSETRAKNSFNPMSALIEIKYSEAGPSLQIGDDTAMNLLASVAGEISKSEMVSPSASPSNVPANEEGSERENIKKIKVESVVGPSQHPGTSGEVDKVITGKQEKKDACLVVKEEQHQTSTGPSPTSKALESSAPTANHEEEHTNKCSSLPASVDSQGEHKSACSTHEKVEDGCSSGPDAALDGKCSAMMTNKVSESLRAEESSLSAGKQSQGLKSTDQNQVVGVPDHMGVIDRCGESTGNLDSKYSVPLEATEVKNVDGSGVGNVALKEEEKKEQCASTSADITKSVASPAPLLGAVKGTNKTKESKDSSSESSSHVNPRGTASLETRHSSDKSSSDDGGKEDLVSSNEGSSFSAKGKSSTGARLDFDLNEGIPGDEGHQSEPASSPLVCSSVHLPSISPFVSPISSGLLAPITVAAPAKGPFVPPETLLRVRSETGWKGSAATSAFRPAEPRKTLEMHVAASDTPVSGAAKKQSRPALDIDLNIADDQALEEDVPQSSAQTTGSESGNTRSRDGPVGIELDLNRAAEVAENGQVLSMFPARPLPVIFSNSDRNCSMDFDLNNGPNLDEAGKESAPRSTSKNSSSIPFLPQVAGIRMNNAEMGNISPWFASGTHGPPVAIQSFLPARGEQPYPIDAAPGTQRIITSAADSGHFGNDSSRTPVISTSPTMVFHPPAYQYPGFPFTPSVHLQAPGFSIGSTPFVNSAPAGVPYFPTITPSLVGPTGVLPGQHARQYAMNFPEGSSGGGHDSSRKWGRQGFDLNSGPGVIEVEGKDERMPLPVRQNLLTPPHALVEDQARSYQMPGVGIKRKESEGSWDAERSQYKQLSWQ